MTLRLVRMIALAQLSLGIYGPVLGQSELEIPREAVRGPETRSDRVDSLFAAWNRKGLTRVLGRGRREWQGGLRTWIRDGQSRVRRSYSAFDHFPHRLYL